MTATADEGSSERQAELSAMGRLAALGTLTVPLAQELAGLLGAIASHAERALGSRANPGSDHDLTQVLAATSRARMIVEQLHRFARRQVKELVPVDLGTVASDGLGLLRLTIPGSIGVQVAVAPELEPVLADQMSAHQVLVSLVSGAAGTMRPGDQLHVSVEGCTVNEALAEAHWGLAPGRYVRLAVRASPAASNGPRSETRGWGFELAVVEGIVRELHGAVVADTGRDGTRTVACLFPALTPRAQAQPARGA